MKCFLCKGDTVKSTTTYMTAYKNCYIIIKNVPCQKCSQCGEEFINGSTMQKIESIISKLKSMLPEITVIDFQNAAYISHNKCRMKYHISIRHFHL